MTSQLELYNVDFTPEKNAYVEDLANYLTEDCFVDILNNFQYIKHNLDLTIKIPFPQSELNNLPFNYVSIKNEEDKRVFYYFVIDSEWKSTATVELQLSMDTVNTFQDLEVFDRRTVIKRQHLDRFLRVGRESVESFNATRRVDEMDEGFGQMVKYKQGEADTIYYKNEDHGYDRWYLIYKTDVNTTSGESVGVKCYLVNDNGIEWYGNNIGEHDVIASELHESFSSDQYYQILFAEDNPGTEIYVNSTDTVKPNNKYSYGFIQSTGDKTLIRLVRIDNETSTASLIREASSIKVRGSIVFRTGWSSDLFNPNIASRGETWKGHALKAPTKTIINANGTISADTINMVDRTDPKLLKVIELPYPPFDLDTSGPNNPEIQIPWGWTLSTTNGLGVNKTDIVCLKLENLEEDFHCRVNEFDISNDMKVVLPPIAERIVATKDPQYESKLYNSAFFNHKFSYDSFGKLVDFERLMISKYDEPYPISININFKPANTISSNMCFRVFPDVKYKEVEDFESYLICNRNNEKALYTSSYLNYLRTGAFATDRKNLNEQRTINDWKTGISSTIQIAGAIGSFFVPGVKTAVSVAATVAAVANAGVNIANTIITNNQNERNFNQKLDEMRHQATSVVQSDDLNLLNYYCGNKMLHNTYAISPYAKDLVFERFYLNGYAYGRNEIPNTKSRRAFNYVECDPVFTNDKDPQWAQYLDDVKARWNTGITVYHRFIKDNAGNYGYDFNQTLENWETWICNKDGSIA